MKTLTLSVDEDVLARVLRYAVERNSSVNALVREFLKRLADQQDRVHNARKRLRELSNSSSARLGPRTWTRDDLQER